MIHFGCISIINHWYMTAIHLLELFITLYWQGLQLVSWTLRPECPQLWLEFIFLTMLSTDKSWSWRRFLWLQRNTINWLSSQCCRQGISYINYLSDTDTQLKMLARTVSCQHFQLNVTGRIRKVFIKFNTTLPSSAPVKRLFSTAGQIEVLCRNHLSDSMFEKLLLLTANHSLF